MGTKLLLLGILFVTILIIAVVLVILGIVYIVKNNSGDQKSSGYALLDKNEKSLKDLVTKKRSNHKDDPSAKK